VILQGGQQQLSGWTQLGGGTFMQHQECFGQPQCAVPLTMTAESGGVPDWKRNCMILFGGGQAMSRALLKMIGSSGSW
jgi:hypothetical protein